MSDHIKKRVAAVTLGCKLNYAETSSIVDNLCQQGWQVSSIEEGAVLIIIHTCAVTKQAEKKSRQKIRGIIRKNPASRVAVIGCYAQLNQDDLASIEGIDAILGSNDKFDLQSYNDITSGSISTPLVKVAPASTFDDVYQGYSLSSEMSTDRTRAFLKIQDGCDYGCAYCTIPMARGRSRSISLDQVVDRAHLLSASGYREIVLTGVNIGDYRYDDLVLCDLLRKLEEVNVSRIRISSIEPDFVDSELVSLVAQSEKIVPHFHIPLQSGSNSILKAMRRRYDTAMYRSRVMHAVEHITDCAIGADVIVGYPGETEEDFLQMYRFIEELPLAYLHVFSCSIRPNTPLARQIANKERNPVKSDEIDHRYAELIELGRRKESQFKERYTGKKCMVLFEGGKPAHNGIQQRSGYTRNYLRVLVESTDNFAGQSISGNEVPVLIECLGDDLNLKGRVLS
jgi:threonylcarbamoyladenosine tRNA methylthiotransferase MtaB